MGARPRAARCGNLGDSAGTSDSLAVARQVEEEDGYDIRTVQELLRPSDVSTTMICTHVLNRGRLGVRSPADGMRG